MPIADRKTAGNTTETQIGGWLRLLGLLLTLWEPLNFAAAAAGSMNALRVRGVPVALVLAARLATTAVAVAAGQALLGVRPSAPSLARVALAGSAVVQFFAYVTPWFPSNRMPGDTPFYVAATLFYYGSWLAYLAVSRRVRSTFA